MRRRASLTRRSFLSAAGATAAVGLLDGIAKPSLSRAADRPVITHGIQSGDVSIDSGIVWARADRPARMLVEVATTDSFKTVRSAVYVDALPETDFTAKALIEGLPAGQDIFYRIRFQDHASPTILSEPQVGRFRTAPSERRSVSFVWSGDTAGGGWGIDEARGGMRSYATMLRRRPDFFIHCGDHIYADCPIAAAASCRTAKSGATSSPKRNPGWRRRWRIFAATTNTTCSTRTRAVQCRGSTVRPVGRSRGHQRLVSGRAARWDGYADKSALQLAARGCRAFHEYMPMRETLAEAGRIYRKIPYGPLLDVFLLDMRSYRTPSATATAGRGRRASSGGAGLAWLKRELMRSQATWKVIAADLPIGVVSADAMAQGDGLPRGREIEIAELLAFIKHAGIRNTVWITADMHYTAAHYYDPNRAVFQDFEPFWEFVSGPLHAGTYPPGELDNTFGPRAVYPEGLQRRAGRGPRALLRAAVLRPRRHRRRDRGDDRHAQGP